MTQFSVNQEIQAQLCWIFWARWGLGSHLRPDFQAHEVVDRTQSFSCWTKAFISLAVSWRLLSVPCQVSFSYMAACFLKANKGESLLVRWVTILWIVIGIVALHHLCCILLSKNTSRPHLFNGRRLHKVWIPEEGVMGGHLRLCQPQ